MMTTDISDLQCFRPPEEAIEASDRQAEVAPHIQDDFADINEDELQVAATKNAEAYKVAYQCKHVYHGQIMELLYIVLWAFVLPFPM